MNETWILASGSPRRRELLAILGVPFLVKVTDSEEKITSEDPQMVTEELSEQKALAVAQMCREQMVQGDRVIVLGFDTVVSARGRILGKPKDRKEAGQMIGLLQGDSHMVYTGVTILVLESNQPIKKTFSVGTRVMVAPMTKEEIEAYLDTDEPYDKAGAYGIQGGFARYIEGIEGDYFNVVGLPVHKVYEELKELSSVL